MEDSRIVDLYWARSEDAIRETAAKYENYCYAIAYNILASAADAEESVNDTWLGAWNAMPDDRPEVLSAYLGKITRRISINRWKAKNAAKRGGGQLDPDDGLYQFDRWGLLEADGTDVAGYDRSLKGSGYVYSMEDGDGRRNTIFVLLCSHVSALEDGFSYPDGKTRTLRLQDFYGPEEGLLAEGVWTFELVLTEMEPVAVELISQPVSCQARSGWMSSEGVMVWGEYTDIEMSTFQLTNMSATCRYVWTEAQERIVYDGEGDPDPVPVLPKVTVVMKDGTSVEAIKSVGYDTPEANGDGYYEYEQSFVFPAPIALDQVDYIQLPQGYTLPMPD